MRQNRPLLGIAFMLTAVSLFPFMGALVQLLSARYPSEQIVWARVTMQLIMLLAMFAPKRGLTIFVTSQPMAQAGRSVSQFLATSLYFVCVKFMHLAQATAISFTTPFMVTALAWPMLGEKFGLHRLMTLIVGFIGVLIIVRPASDVFQWASIGIIASAFFYALYQVLTRHVSSQDSAETSAVYGALFGTIVLSVVMLFRWKNPESWLDALMLAGPGVFGGLGHYCIARAMSYAPAGVVSPFMYWQLVGASILGFFVSGTMPDAYTYLGATILVAAGIYMGWRETRRKAEGGSVAAAEA